MFLAIPTISSLLNPTSGRRMGILRRLVDHGHVVQGLGADLAAAFPGHHGLGAMVQGKPFRYADHQPPVQNHPVGRVRRNNDLLLDVSKRNEKQPGLVLVSSQTTEPIPPPFLWKTPSTMG